MYDIVTVNALECLRIFLYNCVYASRTIELNDYFDLKLRKKGDNNYYY